MGRVFLEPDFSDPFFCAATALTPSPPSCRSNTYRCAEFFFPYFHIFAPSPPRRWTYWSALRGFRYQGLADYGLISISACIHSPRREESIETFLEVADPGNRTCDLLLETASTWLCTSAGEAQTALITRPFRRSKFPLLPHFFHCESQGRV